MIYQEWSMQIGLFAEPVHDRQIGPPMFEKGRKDGRQKI